MLQLSIKTHSIKIILSILLLASPFVLAENQVYKCKTKQDKWIYQNEPCADNQKQQSIELDISKKGYQLAPNQPPVVIQQENTISSASISRQIETVNTQLAKSKSNCEQATLDRENAIERTYKQCIELRNSYCYEAKSASIAGDFNQETWGPKRGRSAYNELKDLQSKKDRYCADVDLYDAQIVNLKQKLKNSN